MFAMALKHNSFRNKRQSRCHTIKYFTMTWNNNNKKNQNSRKQYASAAFQHHTPEIVFWITGHHIDQTSHLTDWSDKYIEQSDWGSFFFLNVYPMQWPTLMLSFVGSLIQSLFLFLFFSLFLSPFFPLPLFLSCGNFALAFLSNFIISMPNEPFKH